MSAPRTARRSPVPTEPQTMEGATIIASGIKFPEGPVAMDDGSVIFVESRAGLISRADGGGTKELVVETGGGPSGLAVGPDGCVYICNNGGGDAAAGRIERFDPRSGALDVLYDGGDGLSSPNDIVFDRHGGFYFTDFGKTRSRDFDKGCLMYGKADGSHVHRVDDAMFGRFGIGAPNGIGLSGDGETLYFVETFTARLYGRRVTAPGEVDQSETLEDAYVYGSNALEWFDGFAIDSAGNICIATLRTGCITVVSADGSAVSQLTPPAEMWDSQVTNLCFGGPDLRDVYVTQSNTGTLLKWRWPRPGNPTAFTTSLPGFAAPGVTPG